MNTLRLRFAAVIAVGLLAACGGDDTDADPADQQDDDTAQAAGHVLVDFQPARLVHDVGASVRPVATVYDEQWQEVDDVELSWSPSPADFASADGPNFQLQQAGTVSFEACTVDDDGQPTSLCGSRQITVSADDSKIVLESPFPGQHFDGADDSTIPVEGSVDPELELDSVQVNGQSVDVDDNHRFAHELEPSFGVNSVVVRGFDGVRSDDYTATATALWAPTYLQPSVEDGITTSFDNALLLTLGQQFLDDGQPYTEISESEIITEDLADILELVLANLDITSELDNPVVDTDALVLSVPDIHFDDPNLELLATDDGIELFGQLTDVEVDTEGFIDMTDQLVDLNGGLIATISVFATLDIEKASIDDDFEVEMDDFELAIEEANPNFDSEEADAIFELANSALRDSIEDILLESFDLSFIDTLPDLVLDVLDSLEDVMADQQFELDLDFGDPLAISFDGQPGQFTPVRGVGLEGHIFAELGLDAEPIHDDKPGIPMLTSTTGHSPMFAESHIQIGLDMTVLNAVFHSLWNAGFLDLNITDLVPESVDGLINSGHAQGLLPPVIAPPSGDSPHDVILQVGQLEIELDWMDQSDRFGVDISVGADLEVIGEEIAIDMADEPDIRVWHIESSDDEPVMPTEDIHELIASILWSDIEEAVSDNLSFALPMPELDILEPYAPALADMALTVRMNRSPDIRDGYLMLDANLEGQHFLD